MTKLQGIVVAVLLTLGTLTFSAAPSQPETATVTVKRELRLKTSSNGASVGAWIITVTCGRETFTLSFDQYIKLGYYDAVHEAEERGAKVTFDGKTTRELANGVETYMDVMSQETTYSGDCPRPK
jgi:hypothetical protein